MMPGSPSTSGTRAAASASASIVVPGLGCSSAAIVVVARRAGHVDGAISASKRPAAHRGFGTPLALEREAVGRLARDAVVAREQFRRLAHDEARERAPEAVAIHRVDQREVAHLVAPPRVVRVDEVRHAAHRLDSAGEHDLRVAGGDRLRSRRDGLQARRARLVQRPRGHAVRRGPCGGPPAAPGWARIRPVARVRR